MASAMPEHLYRFRSIEKLLGGYKELEGQEIYFSTLKQLNDPMEGYKELFWSGDEIVWRNLLRHYLLCLETVCSLGPIRDDNGNIADNSIPILMTEESLRTQAAKEQHEEVCRRFFAAPSVETYAQRLASRIGPVRRPELRCHLALLHFCALDAVQAVREGRGEIPKRPDDDYIRRRCATPMQDVFPAMRKIEQEAALDDGLRTIEDLFLAGDLLRSQANFDAKYNGREQGIDQHSWYVLFEFPDEYVRQLDRLVYGDSYVACFVDDYTNMSMWGNYADGHRGACLKFKVTPHEGEPSIRLLDAPGSRSAGESRQWKFRKVEYGKYPEIDFFRSISRVNRAALRYWYRDADGNESVCADHLYSDFGGWKSRHWAAARQIMTTKLEDWSYEHEYRIVFTGAFDYPDPQDRKSVYDLNDLDGIIFGINTPETDKIHVIQLVEARCREADRTRFDFYQAHYNWGKNRIDAIPMMVGNPF